MASITSSVQEMKELSLNNEATKQLYTMFVTEKIYKQCVDDGSGVLASRLFETVVKMFTLNGTPKEKTLDYTESLKVLVELGLMESIVSSAMQPPKMTISVNTKFDRVSTTAYSKEISDETLHSFSTMAPAEMTPQQKVRFMELLAASMPASQTEGRISPSEEELACSQSTSDPGEVNGQARVIWTHEAVLLLIERRQAHGDLFASSAVTQRQAWRKVSEDLKAKNCIYSEDDCSKKFRSLRARHKTIKEKNSQTGNSRQSWRYFDVMEDMFAGDPAVIPSKVVSSMRPERVPSPLDVSVITEDEATNELPLSSTPRLSRKRRRSSIDDEPPQWFERYQERQNEMHRERMAIEGRRVCALETLVELMKNKQ